MRVVELYRGPPRVGVAATAKRPREPTRGELYEPPPSGATGPLLAALIAAALTCGAAGSLAGCAFTDESRARSPALGGGETEGDVLQVLGKPARVFEAKDEKTGRTRMIWLYERTVDVNGSTAVRRVVFQDGRVVQDEDFDAPRPAVSPDIPPDRTTSRDKDW